MSSEDGVYPCWLLYDRNHLLDWYYNTYVLIEVVFALLNVLFNIYPVIQLEIVDNKREIPHDVQIVCGQSLQLQLSNLTPIIWLIPRPF